MVLSKKIIAFDFDGTLVDSISDVQMAINSAVEKMGYNAFDDHTMNYLVGPDLETSMTKMINCSLFKFSDFEKLFSQFYEQQMVSTTTLYDGVVKTLDWLKGAGKRCIVYTNKPSDQAVKICKTLGIFDYFSDIIGPDTYNIAKPNPLGLKRIMEKYNVDPSDLIMIGDTEIDIQVAKNVNVDVLAVTYGYRYYDDLSKEKPTGFLNSLTDLINHKRIELN